MNNKNFKPTSHRQFIKKFLRHFLASILIIIVSLAGGMAGYHHFEKMSFIDAYVNAAMILSGMGPVSTLESDAGKIFAGSYALYSGIIFLIVMAIMFAPVVHRFLHNFHMEEDR